PRGWVLRWPSPWMRRIWRDGSPLTHEHVHHRVSGTMKVAGGPMPVNELLAATALCSDLTPDEVARIVEAGRVETWPEGSVIMEEGSTGPRLVILLEGRVRIRKRDESQRGKLIAEVGPGAILGEMSLLRDA